MTKDDFLKMDWTSFKSFVDSRDLSIQYIETDNYYDLYAFDSILKAYCGIVKPSSEVTDFEANYKANGNKKLEARDSEGHSESKRVMALDSMHYEPRSLDFVTSKLNSLYNRKHDNAGIYEGTDYGDAEALFWDSSNAQLVQGESESDVDFQTRLTSYCVKSEIYFTPDFSYAIKSGTIMVRETPDHDCYFWCMVAPHIAAEYGGQVPFLSGGYNLSFFAPMSFMKMDGETTFLIVKDDTYLSHRLGVCIKHNAGYELGLQMIYELYK